MRKLFLCFLLSCFIVVTFACGKRSPYSQLVKPEGVAYYHVPIGLCEDYPEETTNLEIIRSDMELLKRAGIGLLRISFGWDAIEAEQDRYNWLFWDDFVRIAVDEYGITLIPYVCYMPKWNSACGEDKLNFWHYPPIDNQEFGEFMTDLVNRYKPWIKSWELWNEPDIPVYWMGSVKQFAELIKTGSMAVRQADPQALVVLGGLAHRPEFTRELFRDYGIGAFVDVVNIHNYYETWHPASVENIVDYVNEISAIIEQYGNHQSLWMAEVGYSTWRVGPKVSDSYTAYYDYEHTPEYQAVDLFKRLSLVLSTGKVAAIAWYEVKDLPQSEDVIGDNNNRNLGVAHWDHSQKPAEKALGFFNTIFSQPQRPVQDIIVKLDREDSDSRVVAFENQDGSAVLVAWLQTAQPDKRGPDKTGLVSDQRKEIITVEIPVGSKGTATIYNELGEGQEFTNITRNEKSIVFHDIHLSGGTVVIIKTGA
jgi:hypothetical protein